MQPDRVFHRCFLLRFLAFAAEPRTELSEVSQLYGDSFSQIEVQRVNQRIEHKLHCTAGHHTDFGDFFAQLLEIHVVGDEVLCYILFYFLGAEPNFSFSDNITYCHD